VEEALRGIVMGEPRVCVLRVGGTNCDVETKEALHESGAKAEIVHLNELVKKGDLLLYDALVIPGGFSHGDHVRAGAILGKRIISVMSRELEEFIEDRRPILGICNGFQVLVEMGLLPGFSGISDSPEAALAINDSAKFECRWVYLRHENRGKCIFTRKLEEGEIVSMPVAHSEGKFVFPKEKEKSCLRRLIKSDQLVFRYCDEHGNAADGRYPENPNGSFYNIAGICDPSGTIFGLMPHPERAYYGIQLPDWTAMGKAPRYADGKLIFESMVEYLRGR